MAKNEKDKQTNNSTHDQQPRTPPKTGGDLSCSGRVTQFELDPKLVMIKQCSKYQTDILNITKLKKGGRKIPEGQSNSQIEDKLTMPKLKKKKTNRQ